VRALTVEDLRRICPKTPAGVLPKFVEPLREVFEERRISAVPRAAAFLAQYAHETQGFTRLEENLRYTTTEALLAATKPRWDPLDADDAWGYLNQPDRLANRVYANRVGNGPEASGDGWKYRGRGLPHLTFRGNYERCGDGLGLPLVDQPDLLLQPLEAARAGGWYWDSEQLNELADRNDLKGIRKRVNGGYNGLAECIDYYNLAKGVLA
jgi:putative chitinase